MPSYEDEVASRFGYRRVTPDTAPKYAKIRELCQDLALNIYVLTPMSREQGLAISAIETAMFWANAAIARQLPIDPNPEVV